MPFADIHGHNIRYELRGEAGLPLVTFANGLTQNADLWTAYGIKLADRKYETMDVLNE